MSPGNDNQVDWTAATTPEGEQVAPSLWRQQKPQQTAGKTPPRTRDNVMDTLLGEHNLSASDISGSDPYNATGRHFRR